MDGDVLWIDTASRVWRRRLGALAWAALEDLALAANPSGQGLVAPVGVRDIAAGIGVTKDTAARAVATLSSAGLVTLERVEGPDGRRRSGYLLRLPEGIEVRSCPTDHDAALSRHPTAIRPEGEDNRCPDGEDGDEGCHGDRDSTRSAATVPAPERNERLPVSHTRPRKSVHSAPDGATQPSLFAPPYPLRDDAVS